MAAIAGITLCVAVFVISIKLYDNRMAYGNTANTAVTIMASRYKSMIEKMPVLASTFQLFPRHNQEDLYSWCEELPHVEYMEGYERLHKLFRSMVQEEREKGTIYCMSLR